MNYSALPDKQLNQLVAETLDIAHRPFHPCNEIEHAWPIITGHGIALIPDQNSSAWLGVADPGYVQLSGHLLVASELARDDNPLRAAMIAFLRLQEQLQLAS